MKKIFLSLLFVFSTHTFAVSPLWVGVGTLTHNFLTAQDDTTGSTTNIEIAPTVLLGTNLPFFFSGSNFVPAIGYAKFFTEDKTSKSEWILQLHANQEVFSGFYFLYGMSTYITRIGGDGVDVQLNNGNGYSTFYAPKETKNSYTSSIDLGGEVVMTSEWTGRLQVSIMRFLSSERRRVSHLISANYFF